MIISNDLIDFYLNEMILELEVLPMTHSIILVQMIYQV